MVAKIFTALDLCDALRRPQPVWQLARTRTILGGSSAPAPTPIPGAAELYFRLPRLAEFYSSLFSDHPGGPSPVEWQIGLVPEVEGVMGRLVHALFFELAQPSAGAGPGVLIYSSDEASQLVGLINEVYSSFSKSAGDGSPDSVCRAVLLAFVKVVNRNYGILRKEEYDALLQRYRKKKTYSAANTLGRENDFSILPDEGEDEGVAPRAAPSDRWALAQGRAGLDRVGAQKRRLEHGASRIDVLNGSPNGDWRFALVSQFHAKLHTMLTGQATRLFDGGVLQQHSGNGEPSLTAVPLIARARKPSLGRLALRLCARL